MSTHESMEFLEKRLEHWVNAEDVALKALVYARDQIRQTEQSLREIKNSTRFVINAKSLGIDDIGYIDGNT